MKFFVLLFIVFYARQSFACSNNLNEHIKETDTLASDALVNKGLEKKESNDWTGANKDFTKAIELDSANFEAYLNRALLRDATSDFIGAMNDYTKVLELNPGNILAYMNRGFIKWSLKNYYAAITDFTDVIQFDPVNGEAYFYRGLIKHHLEQSDNGCQDLEKAKKLGFDLSQEELDGFCK